MFLTPKGRALKRELVPLAEEVNAIAVRGVRTADIAATRAVLLAIIENLARDEQDKRMPSTRALARLGDKAETRVNGPMICPAFGITSGAMNWLTNVVRPKIRSLLKREVPENMWIKCPDTGQLVFYKDVEANQFVIPSSNYHMRMSATARLKSMFDGETWFDIGVPEVPVDPLKFRDERRYTDRLKDARTKTGLNDAIKLGFGKLEGLPVVIGVQDFDFMGGSLGMAAGEAVIKGLETAAQKGTPFIMFAASGGARMQEGILALMQLPRTTVAVEMLREAHKPYIVVLTNPTTGGVTASYAMLGDVHIAEPGALIGFAGPRVIEQTIREKLPEGFQRAEYLKEHGMVDMVVHRHELRADARAALPVLCKAPRRATVPEWPTPAEALPAAT